MESKIEKHKSRFTITQLILMAMDKAPGSYCGFEYLHEKTWVDKKELLAHPTRLAKKGIIEGKWHKSRTEKG